MSKLEKISVCTECHCVGITDTECICVTEKSYKTIELEFEVCGCCNNLIKDGSPANTEFNRQQLGQKEVVLIAAMGLNREIGHGNKLLWNNSEDMKHFKKMTQNSIVVMGRKTHESIGRPLPNRVNIILTNNKDYVSEGCSVVNSLKELFKTLDKYEYQPVFIIGGGEIYTQLMPYSDRIELTVIPSKFPEADAFFPELTEEFTLNGNKMGDTCQFKTYIRK